jgi:hypothetical protein
VESGSTISPRNIRTACQQYHAAIVLYRPNVEPFQFEHQEHLRCPAANAPHGSETRDDLLVVQFSEPVQWHRPIGSLGSKVDDRRSLVARQAGCAQYLGRDGEYRLGCNSSANSLDESSVDCLCGTSRQLLEHDGLGQITERVTATRWRLERTSALDDLSHRGVRRAECFDGLMDIHVAFKHASV